MKIGNKEFDLKNHVYVMGILNVTPDSFSDGGRWNSLDAALIHTEEMIADGADIIDLGGESTRPGHIQITEQEEIDRVIPYIEALKTRFDVPVSIDTYKGTVAEAALAAGYQGAILYSSDYLDADQTAQSVEKAMAVFGK